MPPKRTQPKVEDVDERAIEAEFLAGVQRAASPVLQPTANARRHDTWKPTPTASQPTVNTHTQIPWKPTASTARTLDPMTDELTDVRAFATRIGFLIHQPITHLAPHALLEYFAMIRENVDTLWEGLETHNMEILARGLITIVYDAKLTAIAMGLPWDALWTEMHRTQMLKQTGSGAQGQRVVATAPKGWKAPAMGEILKKYGYLKTAWFTHDGEPKVTQWADYGAPALSGLPRAKPR